MVQNYIDIGLVLPDIWNLPPPPPQEKNTWKSPAFLGLNILSRETNYSLLVGNLFLSLKKSKFAKNWARYLEPCQTSMMEFFCKNN